jgi:hypothetical protein
MASLTYDIGSFGMANRSIDFIADTIEVIYCKTGYTPAKTDTNSVYAAAEITGVSGYTGGYGGAGRQVLGTKAITNDTTNNRTAYGAANPASQTLGTGDTIKGCIVGKKGSASDATAVPIFWLEFASPIPTNGSPFQTTFPSGLLGWTQQ